MRNRPLSLLVISIAFVPTIALAEDAAAGDLAGIVVTATREPAELARQPYSVEVIDSAQLRASDSIADALSDLPGVYVQMPGGRTGFASLYLRGADPNFTTVLLEGVPLDSPTNSRGGATNIAAIPTAAMDRAELVASPVSTLYGSGPLAGALNLLLPAPTAKGEVSLGGSIGTDGEYMGFGQWRGPIAADWGGSLTAVADDAGTGLALSRFRSRAIDLRLAPLEGAGHLLAHYATTRSRGFPDSSGGEDYALIREPELRKSDELVLALDQPVLQSGPATLAIAASYSSRGDEVVSPGVAPSEFSPTGVPAGLDDIRYRHWIVRPTARLDLADWQLTIGAQGQWEKARSEGYLDFGVPVPSGYRNDRATYSGFAEISGSLAALEVNGGLRVDDIDAIGTKLTGRGGLRYFLAPALSLHASAGTAFKAPSFYALGNPFVGNPDLKPESSIAYEAGIEWRPNRTDQAEITLFHARYRDLIDFIAADPPSLANRSRVTAKGISASFSHALGEDLAIGIDGQYVKTVDGEAGEQLLNRPRWRAGASAQWTPGENLTLRARYAFTDDRDDYAIPTGTLTLDETHRASLSAVWVLAEGSELRLDAENLFDDRGQDAVGFRPLGPRMRLGLRYRFD